MMKAFVITLLSCAMICSLASKNSYIQTQNLHKKIGQNLIHLKKEYPGSQKTIYPMLDSVGQLAKTAKNAIIKKKNLKGKIKRMNINISRLSEENNNLKRDLLAFHKAAEQNQQKATKENKKMTADLNQILQEKTELEKKIQELQAQNKKYKEKNKALEENIEKQKLNFNNQASNVQENNKENQNLNLSSTSEPKSPL